jgi:hypothetical protein
MLELFAVLPPEDGAVVMAALENAEHATKMADGVGATAGMAGAVLDPADDPWAARRADALVAVATQSLAGQSPRGGDTRKLVVHVDLDALVGTSDGMCRVDDGPPLPAAVARRIGCDTELVAITERSGRPLNVGRSRRTISSRQRLALQARDATCRFPGCGVPARHTEGHHLHHWADGGRTDLDNLVSLCRFHHHRLHDGAFRIAGDPGRQLRFATSDGTAIGRDLRIAARNASVPPPASSFPDVTARALGGGARCDLGYVIESLADASALARAPSAGPAP